MMKKTSTVLAVCLLGVSMTAFAAKPCAELKSEIDAKFQTKGVKNYTLEVVENGAADSGKTVGTCEAGKKHISYQHGGADAPKAAAKAEAPAAAPAAAAAKPAAKP